MGHDPQWDALVAFTREETGSPWFGKELALTPSTRILDDLRIDGDDAVGFMEKFFDTFSVANIENFPIHRYFGPEGNAGVALLIVPALVAMLFRFALRRPAKSDPAKHRLTLGMLLEAMRAGRWDTASIERDSAESSRAV